MAILEVNNVTKYFGGLRALYNISFNVNEREILALIGPNGAGKSTLFDIITGFYRPSSGLIKLRGKNIIGLKPHSICKLGISRTFQLVKSFNDLTSLENIAAGELFGREGYSNLGKAREEAIKILDFVELSDKKDVVAKNLTLIDRRRLELARVLACHPQLILLDEVMAGLNPTETLKAMKLIEGIRSDLGITVVLVEHVMKAIMSISNRVIVLDHGEIIAEGKPEDVANNTKVIQTYLGKT